ncbi:hypothetical protein [Rhizobium hidalgonense]|uniref:Uncharacterized protein n=1 Tax=Rhizobium hidalgonense TaxID=1538159 RepID=A0ABX4K1B9_9HYPH|nr:hypothetical protein [Rhizobium hidalgonense]PDT24798.1 hypothetical protein CO674_05530 [Rhizobium hidalgonense]PON05397.1 hypothetical protein ATY29_22840 [Rhizobium hidalgonense]
MSEHYSCLTDDEIMAEGAKIAEEQAQGKNISIDELCTRLGITLETALALGAEEASRIYGRPMRIEVVPDPLQ